MTAKELLEEIEATEKLEQRGYKKEECKICKGMGHLYPVVNVCYNCSGKTYIWTAPISK